MNSLHSLKNFEGLTLLNCQRQNEPIHSNIMGCYVIEKDLLYFCRGQTSLEFHTFRCTKSKGYTLTYRHLSVLIIVGPDPLPCEENGVEYPPLFSRRENCTEWFVLVFIQLNMSIRFHNLKFLLQLFIHSKSMKRAGLLHFILNNGN